MNGGARSKASFASKIKNLFFGAPTPKTGSGLMVVRYTDRGAGGTSFGGGGSASGPSVYNIDISLEPQTRRIAAAMGFHPTNDQWDMFFMRGAGSMPSETNKLMMMAHNVAKESLSKTPT